MVSVSVVHAGLRVCFADTDEFYERDEAAEGRGAEGAIPGGCLSRHAGKNQLEQALPSMGSGRERQIAVTDAAGLRLRGREVEPDE